MVGICVKYFHENYGGMLQAYATTSTMEKLGIDYELIRYKKERNFKEIIRMIPRVFNGVLLNDKYEIMLKKAGMKKHPEVAEQDKLRMLQFRRFKETYFTKVSPVFTGYNQLCEGARRYSAVVTGSDQLWSPAGLPTNYYNLMFVPEEIRKISFASSFGVKDIPWYQKRRTATFLNRIDYVSMRENRGAEIVEFLTSRKVPTILDPVFMLNQEEWEQKIPVQVDIQEPYIFAYFLGKNKQYRDAVQEAAKELKCKIVTLPHMDQYVPADETFGDIRLYDIGPEKFLNLIRGAAYVCTDSYHGGCFSVLHRKPFVIFNRYSDHTKHSKNSRIDTLCENLGVQDRRYQKAHTLADQLKKEMDYEMILQRVDEQRKITQQYLETAFSGIH